MNSNLFIASIIIIIIIIINDDQVLITTGYTELVVLILDTGAIDYIPGSESVIPGSIDSTVKLHGPSKQTF